MPIYYWQVCHCQEFSCHLHAMVGTIANMERSELLALFKRALREKGMKAAAASKAASGNPYLIRNMTRPDGQITVPNFENLQRLCEVLGLEFYIGPKRDEQNGSHRHVRDVSEEEVRSAVQNALDDLFARGNSLQTDGVRDSSIEAIEKNVHTMVGYMDIAMRIRDDARGKGVELTTEELTTMVLTEALGRNIYDGGGVVDTPKD